MASNMYKTIALAAAFLAGAVATSQAATIKNNDADAATVVVTEDGVKSELVVGAGETATFCAAGCFVTMPNGDRAALSGSEVIEIVGGAAVIN